MSATRSAASSRPSLRAPTAIAQELLAREAAQEAGDALGREVGLRDRECRALLHEELRVGRLLVGDRTGQRNDDRCHPDRGELRHGDRAATTHDEVGIRVSARHVVDEGDALRIDAGLLVRGTQGIDVAGTGLMQDVRALVRGKRGDGERKAFVQRRGSETAADDEQAQRAGASREAKLGCGHVRDCVAHGIADPLDLRGMAAAQRIRKSEQDPIGAERQHAIGESRHRVGIVQHQGTSGRHTHQRAGKGRESAEAEHHVGRAAAQDAQALRTRGEQRERAEHELAPALAAYAAE